MENKANGQNQKNDWQKKGLGWVPDYPDLRDYSLSDEDIKNNLRLKTDGKTELFEHMLKLITQISKETSITNIEQSSEIKQITNKILGNVFFGKIKVYKLFDKEIDIVIPKYLPNYPNHESILSTQIVELKKYLGVLLIGKYIVPEQDENITHKNGKIVNFKGKEPMNWVLDWIWEKNEDKDLIITALVKDFQKRSGITPDGIVGLETYITLNEYFSDSKKLEKLKEEKRYVAPKAHLESHKSKIRFFSVTSLVPTTAVDKIQSIFISKVIEEIKEEHEKFPDADEKYEQPFLKQINVKFEDFFQTIFHKLLDTNQNKFAMKDLPNLLNKLLNVQTDKNQKNEQHIFPICDVMGVLQSSYLFEPIISVIIKSLSPLAQWQNQTFEELIEDGFDKFESLLPETLSKSSKTNPKFPSCDKLAEDAINQVVYLLKLEIDSLVEESKEIEDEEKRLELEKECNPEKKEEFTINKNRFLIKVLLCFFLKKYLNRFEPYIKNAETAIFSESKFQGTIFNKQEFFEICNSVDTIKIANTQCSNPEKSELFLTLKLHIPLVSNSLMKELERQNKTKTSEKKPFFVLPGVVDLSFWCSPVRDQGSLQSCTAFAAIALLEYFANKNSQDKINLSALFLYKAARHKMNVTGDVGSSIRETMKVLALFGVPPEESWSYDSDKVDEEPPPYCYAYAQNYKTLKYFLLDYAGISNESLLFQIKAVLAAGFPCIFGLTLYTSAYQDSNEPGHIPYPDQKNDKVVGGHTAVVVGYDDYKFMLCADRIHYSQGAFLIRNSWGPEWGVKGYGWIPYDYVLAGLTAAWWSLLKSEWFNEDNFGLAGTGGDGAGKNTKAEKVGTKQK